MKNVFLYIVLTSIVGVSCNSSKLYPQDAYIQLTKKRCFGKCPVYDLFIYTNGNVLYNGIDNVNKKGKHQFKISKEQLNEIEQLFQEAKFNSLNNQIDQKIRDLPITMIKYHDKKISFQGQRIPEKVKEIIEKLEILI